jgi:HK97 gp10 family phage protein
MTQERVTVTGIPETKAALAAFGERASNDAEVATQAAGIVAAAARVSAPVRTGLLAASYTVEERYVVNPIEYAPFVEFGTDRVAPQAVITNAMEASAEQVAQLYAEWLAQQAGQLGFEAKSEQ